MWSDFFLAKKEPFLILHANVIWDTPDYEWHALSNVLCRYDEMIISLWINLVVHAFTVITS